MLLLLDALAASRILSNWRKEHFGHQQIANWKPGSFAIAANDLCRKKFRETRRELNRLQDLEADAQAEEAHHQQAMDDWDSEFDEEEDEEDEEWA